MRISPWSPPPPRCRHLRVCRYGCRDRSVVTRCPRSSCAGPCMRWALGSASINRCRGCPGDGRTWSSRESGLPSSSTDVSGTAVLNTRRTHVPTASGGAPSWRATSSGTARPTARCSRPVGRCCASGSTTTCTRLRRQSPPSGPSCAGEPRAALLALVKSRSPTSDRTCMSVVASTMTTGADRGTAISEGTPR